MIYSLYRGLTQISGPLLGWYLNKRLAAGKEHKVRFGERMGQTSHPRPAGKLIWLHGASVGEAVSLLPVIRALREKYGDGSILMTTGTVTSAALMEQRLPTGVIHQFVPVDHPTYVGRFLDHWQPDLAIWAESELWPNLVCETFKRGVPMALINARMSDKSLGTWQKVRGFAGRLLGAFDVCLAQTETDAARFQMLGARQVSCPGNLKYAAGDLPVDETELADLSAELFGRQLWMAASTHAGEEAAMGRVHQQLKKSYPDTLSLIAPRHPERGDAIAVELREQGLVVAQRSRAQDVTCDCDVYLLDTLGELGLFYRLSPIVFMGKSLTPLGGQNPLEPARLNCALLCGPYMTNFAEIMERFQAGDAIGIVRNEGDLAGALKTLFSQDDHCQRLAGRAHQVARAEEAVLERTLDALRPLLEKAMA